jgi:Tol biopolymer transport system component
LYRRKVVMKATIRTNLTHKAFALLQNTLWILCVLLLSLIFIHAPAEAGEVTISIDCWHGGECPPLVPPFGDYWCWNNAAYGLPPAECLGACDFSCSDGGGGWNYGIWPEFCSFQDPLPAGTTLTRVKATIHSEYGGYGAYFINDELIESGNMSGGVGYLCETCEKTVVDSDCRIFDHYNYGGSNEFREEGGFVCIEHVDLTFYYEQGASVKGDYTGQIAFREYLLNEESWTWTDYISLLNPATGEKTRLIEDGSCALDSIGVNLAVSFDGRQVLFTGYDLNGGFGGLRIIGTDGTGYCHLTDNQEMNGVFSPAGDKVAYTGFDANGYPQIFIADYEKDDCVLSNPKQLTHGWLDYLPFHFSPIGNQLVYGKYVEYPFHGSLTSLSTIFMMSAERGDEEEIDLSRFTPSEIENGTNEFCPKYRPSGDRIVFTRWNSGGWAIVTLDLTDPELDSETTVYSCDNYPAINLFYPSYSPDGTYIVFVSNFQYETVGGVPSWEQPLFAIPEEGGIPYPVLDYEGYQDLYDLPYWGPSPAGCPGVPENVIDRYDQIISIPQSYDPINQVACNETGKFCYVLYQDARITLDVKINDQWQRVVGPVERHLPTPEEWRCGNLNRERSRFEIVPGDMFPLPDAEGPYDFRFEATSLACPQYKDIKEGKVFIARNVHANLPVGHTFVKNVDVFNGHAVLQREDFRIEDRGLPVQFFRTYGSAGFQIGGPLGPGWTHNYNVRLEISTCNDTKTYTVIGGEGTGQTFLWNASTQEFVPPKGYHGTLTYNAVVPEYIYRTKHGIEYPTCPADPISSSSRTRTGTGSR